MSIKLPQEVLDHMEKQRQEDMKDPNYTKEIVSGDIHTANQKAAGLKTRDESKRFIYAYLYGGGDVLIGKICGGGRALGKKIKA